MNTQAPPPKHTPGPWITDSGKVPKLGHAIGVLKQNHEVDVQKRLVENECQIRNLARALQSAISRMETIRETHGHTIALDRDIENLKMWLPQPDAPTCEGEKRPAQCRILGCGRFAPAEEMRTYRIGSTPFDACPECWNAMELPEDCRDTADLGHNAEVSHGDRERKPDANQTHKQP